VDDSEGRVSQLTLKYERHFLDCDGCNYSAPEGFVLVGWHANLSLCLECFAALPDTTQRLVLEGIELLDRKRTEATNTHIKLREAYAATHRQRSM